MRANSPAHQLPTVQGPQNIPFLTSCSPHFLCMLYFLCVKLRSLPSPTALVVINYSHIKHTSFVHACILFPLNCTIYTLYTLTTVVNV
jgi:hypothetical protein